VDAGEAELRRRAIEGVERLKYDRSGVLMQRERVYSDKLLEVYVRANKPNKYREKDANVNVQVGIAFTMNAPPARSISIQAKTCNNTATEQDQRPKTLDIDVDETDS